MAWKGEEDTSYRNQTGRKRHSSSTMFHRYPVPLRPTMEWNGRILARNSPKRDAAQRHSLVTSKNVGYRPVPAVAQNVEDVNK